ncbi:MULTISPECIES: cytochrome-c peroxidase [unclassified Pseudoalteromonas]|uniref:cytochrome-c peroxidase n=1 Tax=unclassified Pseudoalteromonas TaxID=194690 RepID=UPI0005A8FA9C|nr:MULTISPECIES: cytochrome c peroxidase [unclassified Pseudoalteromonas]
MRILTVLFIILSILIFSFAPFSYAQEPLLPLNITEENQSKIQLGKQLFNDVLLSKNRMFSCASCHHADKAYSDGKAFSLGADGKPLSMNTPSLEYLGLNYYFTWTGKFSSLNKHLDMLITSPKIMNNTWETIIKRLSNTQHYPLLFTKAGYFKIAPETVRDAIISFELSLSKPSRFDLYLQGDTQQLTTEEIKGYQLFKDYGCSSCHQGMNVGGNMRQKFGVMRPYFNESNIKLRDYGYFNTSKNESDKYFFRVPSLRNVSKTAPYFHDASAKTLTKAIKIMFKYQLGIYPSDQDVKNIEAFLMSLDAIYE